MNNKRLILTFAIPLLLIPAVFLTIYLVGQRQELRREAAEGEASLSLYPETGTFEKDQTFDVNILLDTGGLPVVGADVSLSFDSTKLQAQSATPGTIFQNQITFKNEIGEGKILLSLGSLTPFTGVEVYGTIRFLAIGAGESAVTFDETPYCKVAQQGGGDILGETQSSTYTIAGPKPTPPEGHCLPLGDIDCSRLVNSLDFSYLLAFFNTSDVKADLDNSGAVNSLDVSCFLANFGLEDPNEAICQPGNF